MTQELKPDCSNHKRDVLGISDMAELANLIGDLHYETLSLLLDKLADKIYLDAAKDRADGRVLLSEVLELIASDIYSASIYSEKAWQICKPFMENKTSQ